MLPLLLFTNYCLKFSFNYLIILFLLLLPTIAHSRAVRPYNFSINNNNNNGNSNENGHNNLTNLSFNNKDENKNGNKNPLFDYNRLRQRPKPVNEQLVNDLKSNNINDIAPDKHLDAIPIDTKGNLNRDLHKELFLGDHEEIENLNEKRVAKRLKHIFHQADSNKNGVLNEKEVENWMLKQIQSHLNDAINRNERLFLLLDEDKNSAISWDTEYLPLYEKLHGLDTNTEDEPSNLNSIKKELALIRERWINSDQDNDDCLNKEEFLSFRHPETSQASLSKLVDILMSNMDKNYDGNIDQDEFLLVPSDLSDDDDDDDDDSKTFIAERKEEFKNIDKNHDNKIDFEELKEYVSPHNPRVIKSHVKEVFENVDNDKNGLIDLKEMLQSSKYFINNKFLNAGNFFHDDL